jgi:hypothetical protein
MDNFPLSRYYTTGGLKTLRIDHSQMGKNNIATASAGLSFPAECKSLFQNKN